jgi:hypothetical protein
MNLRRFLIAVSVPLTALAVITAPVDALSATKPALVKSTIITYAPYQDVVSSVVVDGPATITLTNLAYRHPEQVQATVVTTTAGTFQIRDLCKPYLLAHTWIVYVNDVKVAQTTGLNCQ